MFREKCSSIVNMSQDFSKLSYKELQSLATANNIPGNIKRELIVDFLEALKCGNTLLVERMLDDLKETRKRKVRKRKLEKLEKMTAVTSTPMHSPNYSIDDRFYSPQHLSPYRWSVPEEDLAKREVPAYEMFRQYLLQRIQKNYQNFDTSNDAELDTAAVLNLKADPLEFTSQPNVFTTNPTAAKTILSSPILDHQAPESRHVNDNNCNKPMILQKMLQAPLGTNLGAVARHEANRMWPLDHYRSLRAIEDNNSDTITANSESDDDDDEEWTGRECYNVIDNRRPQNAFAEQTQIPQINLDQMMMNYLHNNGQNGYQMNNPVNFALPNVQENCQAWIDNSLDYREPIDYTETTSDTSRMYPSYSNDQANYSFPTEGNVTNFGQSQAIDNNNLQMQNAPNYYQFSNENVQDYRPEFYQHNNSSTMCGNATFNGNASHSFNPVHSQDSLAMYSQESAISASYSAAENYQYSGYTNQCGNQSTSGFTQTNREPNVPMKSDDHSRNERNGDAYWPKWSNNNGSHSGLENILNLNTTGGQTDYAKFNQTSSVYCFSLPLSCPLSGSSSSQHVERAEFVTAGRFHTFAPNSLVYSDSTTGMRMANLPVNNAEETDSEESSITIGYRSDDSFQQPEPIQEVWITDFSNQQDINSNEYLSSSCETLPE